MNNTRFSYARLRSFSSLLLLSALCACSWFEPSPEPVKEVKKHHHPKVQAVQAKHYDMDTYVKQLTLTRYMLEKNNTDIAALKPQLAIIESFAADKRENTVFQPVIVISYSVKGKKEVQQLIAPFKMSQNILDFPDLQEIMPQLEGIQYTIQDVHPALFTSLPVRNLNFPVNDPGQTRNMINRELGMLLRNRSSFMDIDEARVQMSLLQFFMDHHVRDAAYLAAENAKQSLAAAEDNHADTNIVNTLSDRLGMLEGQLRKNMPFSLNAL